MGTNFYFTGTDTHIGKRSAAGQYCWDCRKSLCIEGELRVHESHTHWRDTCPACGSIPIDEQLRSGSAAVEFGFAKPYQENERTGVKSASSFSWAIQPQELWRSEQNIKDEYGRLYNIKDFQEQVLANCPIEFTDSIGLDFS